MKNKTIFLIIFFLLPFLGGGIYFYYYSGKVKRNFSLENKEKEVEKPTGDLINQLPIEKRPFVVIEPKSKTRPQDIGYWLTISMDNVESWKMVEYEVEYQTKNMIQGFIHRIDFSQESPPFSKEGFFGSESKGKYKYDEGVKNGSVFFKFFKEEKNYDAFKTYFNVLKPQEDGEILNTNDGKAALLLGKEDLKNLKVVVISSTLGLPKMLSGKIISEPYGFYASDKVRLKDSFLIIKTKESLKNPKIFGWHNDKWQEYEVVLNKEEVKAKIKELGTYVLIDNV